jgi:hypothetical protein
LTFLGRFRQSTANTQYTQAQTRQSWQRKRGERQDGETIVISEKERTILVAILVASFSLGREESESSGRHLYLCDWKTFKEKNQKASRTVFL